MVAPSHLWEQGVGHRMEITWRTDLSNLLCPVRFCLPGFCFWGSLTFAVQCHSLHPVPWAREMDTTGQFFQNPGCFWGDRACWAWHLPWWRIMRVGPESGWEIRGVQGWGEVVTVAFKLSVVDFSAGYSSLKHSIVKQVWVHIWIRTTNQYSVSKLCFLQLYPSTCLYWRVDLSCVPGFGDFSSPLSTSHSPRCSIFGYLLLI